jgi:hypothetical protein
MSFLYAEYLNESPGFLVTKLKYILHRLCVPQESPDDGPPGSKHESINKNIPSTYILANFIYSVHGSVYLLTVLLRVP